MHVPVHQCAVVLLRVVERNRVRENLKEKRVKMRPLTAHNNSCLNAGSGFFYCNGKTIL